MTNKKLQTPVSNIPTRDPQQYLSQSILQGQSGYAGKLDELIYGNSRIFSGVSDFEESLTTLNLKWVMDNQSPSERLFTEFCKEVFNNVTTDVKKGSSKESFLKTLANYWIRGACVYEVSWYNVNEKPVLELYPIHLSTIQSWIPNEDRTSYEEIHQTTNYGYFKIPYSKILHIAHRESEGPQGVSILRPLVFIFEKWKNALLYSDQRRAMESGGVVVQEKGEIIPDQQAKESFRDEVDSFAFGENKTLYVPAGFDFEIINPTNSGTKLTEELQYYDAQIDLQLDNQLLSLGYSSHGSRALGEAVEQDAAYKFSDKVNSMLADFSREFTRVVAEAIGYEGRKPRLMAVNEMFTNPEQEAEVKENLESSETELM